MSEHHLFVCRFGYFANALIPLLKVAAPWFGKLVIGPTVDASAQTRRRGACESGERP